jgi:8-oxo-dGTP diphosphatase
MEVVALAAVWSKVCTPPATIFGFLGRHTDGAVVPSDETPEVGWYTPDDALNLVTHRVNRDRLLTLLNHGGVLIHCTYQARPFLQLGVMEVEPSALAQTLRVIVDPSEIGASVAPSSPLP